MGKGLSRLIGLEEEKLRFQIQLARCLHDETVFPHTLFFGVGGTGKTALARAMAEELQYYFVEVEAASLRNRETINDMLLTSIREAEAQKRILCLFVDEVHRLTVRQQEAFYYPMKEWRIIEMNNHKRNETLLSPFTFFAATTRLDMLDEASLVNRFPNRWKVNRYSTDNIMQIICNILGEQGLHYYPETIKNVAERCHGIPRTANNLTHKIIDQTIYRKSNTVTENDVENAFSLEGIDSSGLTRDSVKYLEILNQSSEAKGVDYLAGRLGLQVQVVEANIEPNLMFLGFIDRGRGGRIITELGKKHLTLSEEMVK